MKRSYHPFIPLLYKLGVLDSGFTSQIPKSTLHEWKHKDFNNMIGACQVSKHFPDADLQNDYITKKDLSKIVNATYRVYHTYSQIYSGLKIKKSKIEQHQKQIIHTIESIKGTIGFDKALRAFHLSRQQFYRWKNKVNCDANKDFLCSKKHPLRLSNTEVKTVKSYLVNSRYAFWPIVSIYYKMLRNHDAFMSLTTFYKYVNLFGYKRQKPSCRNKKYKTGIRATKPFEILHADVTIFKPLDNTKVYIYFIVDNFSRKILGWKVSNQLNAKLSFENLREVYYKYKPKIRQGTIFMTDGGSENKAGVDNFIQQKGLLKIIAQKDVISSNSMVESVFNKFKYQFLFTKNLFSLKETKKYINVAVPDYNNRPHASLYGLTPSEAINGTIPNKNLFKLQKNLAKKIRITENKECNSCE